MKERQVSEFQGLAMKICDILDYNKAIDINLVDISKTSNVADYFVVCTAESRVQVRAIMDELEHALESEGVFVLRRDGVGDGRWVVLDYGVVVVHIFTADLREFYHIEKLWADGKNTLNMAGLNKLKDKLKKEQEAEKQKEEKAQKSAEKTASMSKTTKAKGKKTDSKQDETQKGSTDEQ